MKKGNNEGFTLIEVALSIVVVAIGIMAVFSLIGSGLESNKKAISESQAAIFANDVFNSLRSASQQTNYMVSTPIWEGYWINLKHQQPQSTNTISVAGEMMWGSPSNTLYVYANDADSGFTTVYSIAFTNTALHGGTAPNPAIVNGGLQYRLDVHGPPILVGTQNVERVNVTLYVWDGIFGSGATPPLNKALVFYSEYNNPGEI